MTQTGYGEANGKVILIGERSPIKITFPFASPYPVCVILQSPLALSNFFHF